MTAENTVVDRVVERELDKLKKRVEEYLERGIKEIDKARENTLREVEKMREEYLARANSVRSMVVSSAELKSHGDYLRVFEEKAREILDEVLTTIRDMPRDEGYARVLEKLILEGLGVIGSEEALVIPSKQDYELVKHVADRLARNGVKLSVSEDVVDSVGGVVIVSKDRNTIFNNTFEARLSRVSEEAKRIIFELTRRM